MAQGTEVDRLFVALGADISDFRRQMGKAQQTLADVGQTMRRIGTGLTATVTAPLLGMAAASVKAAGDLEQTRVALETLTGSADAADATIRDLQQFAATTPFRFQGLTQGVRLLITMGLEAQEATSAIKTISDAVAAAGGTTEDLNGVARAIGQIQAKGKASAEELLQLAERGIPAYEILQEQLGLTGDEVANIGNEGISASRAINALLTGLQDRFAGAAEAQAQTINGLFSTLRDNIRQASQVVGEALVETST